MSDAEEMIAEARALVAAGRGDQLMLTEGWWTVISAKSYLDFNENCPDVLDSAGKITCPVLYVTGEQEPEARYPMLAFAERCAGPADTLRIPEAATSTPGSRITCRLTSPIGSTG